MRRVIERARGHYLLPAAAGALISADVFLLRTPVKFAGLEIYGVGCVYIYIHRYVRRAFENPKCIRVSHAKGLVQRSDLMCVWVVRC